MLVSSLYARLHNARQKAEANLAKLQLSEEKYRRIVDTADEGIWLLNGKLHTEFVNEQLALMLGYGVLQMSARSFEEFIASTNHTEMKKIVERWQDGSKEKFDCCFCTKNGSELWAEQDLMISDIGMPNVNGYTLMRQVRNSSVQHRQIPAIALTGYTRDFDIQQAQLAGFHKTIAKPVEQAKLISAIGSIV